MNCLLENLQKFTMADLENGPNHHMCKQITKKENRTGLLLVAMIICVMFLCSAIALDSILYYTSPIYLYKLHKLDLINHTFPSNYSKHIIHL